MVNDIANELASRVCEAHDRHLPLSIRGSGSKRFLTGEATGTPLDVTGHRGIVSYEPTELVLTARAGTPLREIEQVLAQHNQMLAFEPPHFGPNATLGGTIACNLSGPRRPWSGATRDFVLGTKIINGQGEILSFGGQVMKNVAGYDVSRLMAGARGTLGVLLDVSLKVLPRPAQETTLTFESTADEAIERMNAWSGQPLPLSGACHSGNTLHLRLSGTESALRAAHTRLGGEAHERGPAYWEDLREHRRAFFKGDAPLWRLSLPPATPIQHLPGKWIIDWGGAQRWLQTDASPEEIHRAATAAGGYAQPWRGVSGQATTPLSAVLLRLHEKLKLAFDPAGLLNASAT